MEQLREWAPLGVFVLQLLVLWGSWSMRRAFVSAKACESCRKVINDKLVALGQGAAVAEARRDGLATAREVGEVKAALVALQEQVKALAELIERGDRQVKMLMDYHLPPGGNKS